MGLEKMSSIDLEPWGPGGGGGGGGGGNRRWARSKSGTRPRACCMPQPPLQRVLGVWDFSLRRFATLASCERWAKFAVYPLIGPPQNPIQSPV